MNALAPVAAPALWGLWGWLTATALLAGASVVAFWPGYLARPVSASSVLVHLHAALAVGWYWRGKRGEHTRAMAGTLVVMVDPALARLAGPLLPVPALPYAGPAAVWLLLLALIWRDHRQGMRWRTCTFLLVASLPGPLLAPTIARTEAWLALAEAFARIGAVP